MTPRDMAIWMEESSQGSDPKRKTTGSKAMLREGETVLSREELPNQLSNTKQIALNLIQTSNIIQTEKVVFTCLDIYKCIKH